MSDDIRNEVGPGYSGERHSNLYATLGATTSLNHAMSREPLNPWISIWFQPRATIRQVVETDPQRHVLILAGLAGIGETLNRASAKDLGDLLSLPAILLIAFVGGPIGGIVSLYVGGFLLRATGRWMGGVASSEQVRAAIAYGSIPAVFALLLWIPELGLLGHEMFREEMPTLEANLALLFAFLAIMFCEFVLAVWQLVAVLKCVGEVHQFSAWRALGASILAGAAVIVPLLVIILGAMLVMGAS